MPKITPFLKKKPSSLRYFQEGPKPIDLNSWHLEVIGEVRRPLSLSYEDILSLPSQDHHRRTVCVCLWTIKRYWTGVSVQSILEMAGIDLSDMDLYLRLLSCGTQVGVYDSTVHMKSSIDRNAILAYRVDDASLPLENGYPLRFIDFGLFGYKCVKALRSIEVTRTNEIGYWEAYAGYNIDGTVQSKKYYAVDLQKKIWFGETGEIKDSDI